jgi:GGDEF domain-containing protein
MTFQLAIVVALLVIAVAAVAMASLVIARLRSRLRELQLRDPATGLPSRRLVAELLPGRLALAERQDLAVVVAAVDVGDGRDGQSRVAARAWRPHVRSSDIFGHAGDDELVLVLSGTSLPQAERLLDRLRATLPAGAAFAAGLASWAGEDADALVGRAEDAMRAARSSGPGRTVVAQIA